MVDSLSCRKIKVNHVLCSLVCEGFRVKWKRGRTLAELAWDVKRRLRLKELEREVCRELRLERQIRWSVIGQVRMEQRHS